MTAYTFDQIIDYTRTSAATYVNSSGNIASTPQSRNLLTFTQELVSGSSWDNITGGTGVAPTLTANVAVAPDGTMTADRLQFSLGGGTTTSDISRRRQLCTTPATTHTFSIYLRSTDGSSTYNMHLVDPSGTTIGIVVTGTWQRFSVTATGTGAAVQYSVGLRGGQSPANSNTADILAWGAQVESGSAATDYTRNVGGVYPPRFDYDPVTLAPRGLLIEEQRTNLFTYSEQFDGPNWTPTNLTATANSTTSPDGTVDADTLNEGTATGVHSIAQTFSSTSGTSYAISAYLKNGDARYAQLFFGSAGHGSTAFANFDLQSGTVGTVGATATASITGVGNGWYRCTIVAAATATTASASGQVATITSSTAARAENYTGASKFIYAWGAQLEAGAFATSYIPTVASQVTRTADQATVTGANFSRWFNGTEGSWVAEFDVVSTATASKVFFTTSNGTSDNVNYGYVFNTAATFAEVRSGGATQATLGIGTATPNTTFRAAMAYRANDFAAAGNGGAVSTDTSGAVPLSQSELNLGYSRNYGGLYLNGHLRRIKYYPTRLSNTQLQALTA